MCFIQDVIYLCMITHYLSKSTIIFLSLFDISTYHAQVDTTCKKVDSVTCYFLFICCR